VERLLAKAPPHLRPCILFEDEAGFGRISSVRACWAPPGMRPIVGAQQVREYRSALLTVAPWEGRISALIASRSIDHDDMGRFLRETRRRFPRRYCILFLDGAGAHTSQNLQVPPNMHLEFLPPYSPELNPVESVWDYVREHYFANRALPTLRHVDAQLCEAFHELDATPALVRSITLFEWMKAAKLTTG